MKVCILGPVNTTKYFGGVAIFTESLADAFKDLGYEVTIITDYSEKTSTTKKTPIISVGKKSLRKSFFLKYKLKKAVAELEPNLVISSLEYGLANGVLKKENLHTIHYLHAFPSVRRSLIDAMSVFLGTYIIAKKSDFVIANSGLTSVINSEIFFTSSDSIINVGLGNEFIDYVKKNKKKSSEKSNRILFAGRLVKEKNVDKIIRAFDLYVNSTGDTKTVLDIVGEGPEKESLTMLVNKLRNKQVKFHGKVNPDNIPNYYFQSDLFISLNPHEPYGIVYLEALASGCKIVCPSTGGQLDSLLDYKGDVYFVNVFDLNEISQAIKNAIQSNFTNINIEQVVEKHSYAQTVSQIERFLKQRGILANEDFVNEYKTQFEEIH